MGFLVRVFIFTFLFISRVFAGEVICDPQGGKSALVVIDMQPGFITRGGNHKKPANAKKVDDVIAAQITAIQKARAYNVPIIFIEYEGDYGDTNSKLKDAVNKYARTQFFKKNADGVFESYNKHRGPVIDFLKKNKVSTLIVTGANGGACVQSSITGSLEGNCNVVAYSNGIADFNYEDYMHPYAYKDLKPNCVNCTFRETSNLLEVARAMVPMSKAPVKPQTLKQKRPGV